MNTWLLIRRLRGPAFLILVGITALLNQWGVLSFGPDPDGGWTTTARLSLDSAALAQQAAA